MAVASTSDTEFMIMGGFDGSGIKSDIYLFDTETVTKQQNQGFFKSITSKANYTCNLSQILEHDQTYGLLC